MINAEAIADSMMEESIQQIMNEGNLKMAYEPFVRGDANIALAVAATGGRPVCNTDCLSLALH